ncbi:hypothetical protein [Streptomyces phaeoluteigriseus]|uniref:hypothetical protein n=1 Tax=Streptomyces phaeoluteigriseus TaxID=114686 RepID=UPI0036B551A6
MGQQDLTLLAMIAAPLVLGALARLLRRPHRALADLTHTLRDLITLRMVLRDSDPEQRADLLDAHRDWRTEPADKQNRQQPKHAERPRQAGRAPSTPN